MRRLERLISLNPNSALNTLIQSISDPNTFFTSNDDTLFKSSDGGSTWSSINGNLPIGNGAYRISAIAVSNVNKDKIWVTMAGYNLGDKVYYTNNGGTSWANVSGTLPNIPVNCIVYQNGSNDLVYIGTDFGVFYKDNSMNDWQPYGNGLPNVIVNELEIQYTVGKLRAATYGRGLWETDIATTIGIYENPFANEIKLYPNPNNGKFIIETYSTKPDTKIVVYNLLGENVFETKINLNRNEIDMQILPAGNYILSAETAKGVQYKKMSIIK